MFLRRGLALLLTGSLSWGASANTGIIGARGAPQTALPVGPAPTLQTDLSLPVDQTPALDLPLPAPAAAPVLPAALPAPAAALPALQAPQAGPLPAPPIEAAGPVMPEGAADGPLGQVRPPGPSKAPLNPQHRAAKFLAEMDLRLSNLERALGAGEGEFLKALRDNLTPGGPGALEEAARHVLLDALVSRDYELDDTEDLLRRGGALGGSVADRLVALTEKLEDAPVAQRWRGIRQLARLRRKYLREGEKPHVFSMVAAGNLGAILGPDIGQDGRSLPLNAILLEHPYLLTPDGKPTAASAVRALMEVAGRQQNDDLRKLSVPLGYVFVPAETPLTLHAYRSRSSVADLYISRVALELPRPGVPTLWDALDEKEREILVITLQEILRRGRYSNELNVGAEPGKQALWDKAHLDAYLADEPAREAWEERLAPSPEPGPEELARRKTLFADLQKDRDRNGPLGISPRRLLLAAMAGVDIGVCRHINQALIGLLMELGAPPDQLRLVAGAQRPGVHADRHLFGMVRLTPGGRWIEVDGTPGTRKDPQPLFKRYRYGRVQFRGFFRPIAVRRRLKQPGLGWLGPLGEELQRVRREREEKSP